jgi:putative tryptophan/tyrosine transport system ATP-binding protein
MNLLSLENVSLTLPGSTRPLLDHINYEIKYSDFVILLGSNGSGKSTLLKLINRQFNHYQGHISYKGRAINLYKNQIFNREVILLSQNCQDSLFNSLTLYENYLLRKYLFKPFYEFINHKKQYEYLSEYLYKFNDNLPSKLNLTMDKLSGGEKQAFALALCFIYPPSLLLLDEHTSALDPKSSARIMQLTCELIKEHNITSILATHDLEIAEQYGNRLLILRDGKVRHALEKSHDFHLGKEYLIELSY